MARSLNMTLRIDAPGPGGSAHINSLRFLHNPAFYALDHLAQYRGPVVPITGGNGAMAIARGAEPVHRFFSDTEAFGRPSDGVLALPPGHSWSHMTRSMVTMNGSPHRQRRKIVLPALVGRALDSYEPVFRTTLLNSRFAGRSKEPFDIVHEFRQIARDNMLVCLFGLDTSDANRELAERLTSLLGELLSPPVLILRGNHRWTPYGRCLHHIRQAHDQLAEIIERRRTETIGPDALSLLCHARTDTGLPLTTGEIAGELTGLFEGGYETAASSMTWSLLTSLYHPFAAHRQMANVVNETHRLIPTAPVSLPRRVLHDTQFAESVVVPAGTIMFASTTLEHLNPDVYPEPHEFRPDRWGNDFRPPHHAFLPFGTGYRRCIGAKFAEHQALTTLRLAFDRSEWDLLTGRIDYGIHNGIVSVPRQPVMIQRGKGTVPPKLRGTLTKLWQPGRRAG